MPPAEPTPTDVAAVAAMLSEQPTATPPAEPTAPAQPAASEPTAPTAPADPFASLFATEPAAPTEPTQPTEIVPTVQPTQPTEVAQPATTQPTAPVAPVAQPETYQTYDEYMSEIVGSAPAMAMPDPDKIDPNNPEAIKGFFDELVKTAVNQSKTEIGRQSAIQTKERQLWDASFDKYGSLKTNKPLRDMVHDIRMGYFRRGQAITPTQAADKLLESMGHQYKQGVADTAVITTIENVQPNGGGTGAPIATTLDKNAVLESIQTGGEVALADYLDGEVKAGRL